MKRLFLLIGLLVFVETLFCVDFHDFDSYQGKLTSEEVSKKITAYLEKNPSLRDFYQITPDALYIGDLAHQKVDYVLHLATTPQSKKQPYKSMKDVKIAIDPGHFGGVYKDLEDRVMRVSSKEGEIAIDEGTLTYLTAIQLKALLEEEGAKVLLTRSGIGQGAIQEPFSEWLEKRPELKKSSSPLPETFRIYYNKEDLYKRAEKINAFSPDLTIIIHYNYHLLDSEKEQQSILTKSNFSLAFIPGSFCAHELDTQEDRYEFLRLIVTNVLDESLLLSEQIMNEISETLHVPLHSPSEKNSYTETVCLIQKKGIYSRNLFLTRHVHSPVCYGETFLQNNEEEFHRFSIQDSHIGIYPCSKRIQEVAKAYFEGIKKYVESKMKQSDQ